MAEEYFADFLAAASDVYINILKYEVCPTVA